MTHTPPADCGCSTHGQCDICHGEDTPPADVCPDCKGTKTKPYPDGRYTCPSCGGTGARTAVTDAIDTHVWCESDGNNGVVPARHRVYEGSMPPSHPQNVVCDGTRATHTPLYRGAPPPAPAPKSGKRTDMSNTTEYVRDMDAYQEALAKAQGNPICNAHVWLATPTEVRMRVDCNRDEPHSGERTVVTAWGETNAHWHKPTDEEPWFLEWYDDTPFAEPNTISKDIKVVRSEPMEDPTTTAEREPDATHIVHGHDGVVLAVSRSATGIVLTQLERDEIADLLWELSEAAQEADS